MANAITGAIAGITVITTTYIIAKPLHKNHTGYYISAIS